MLRVTLAFIYLTLAVAVLPGENNNGMQSAGPSSRPEAEQEEGAGPPGEMEARAAQGGPGESAGQENATRVPVGGRGIGNPGGAVAGSHGNEGSGPRGGAGGSRSTRLNVVHPQAGCRRAGLGGVTAGPPEVAAGGAPELALTDMDLDYIQYARSRERNEVNEWRVIGQNSARAAASLAASREARMLAGEALAAANATSARLTQVERTLEEIGQDIVELFDHFQWLARRLGLWDEQGSGSCDHCGSIEHETGACPGQSSHGGRGGGAAGGASGGPSGSAPSKD